MIRATATVPPPRRGRPEGGPAVRCRRRQGGPLPILMAVLAILLLAACGSSSDEAADTATADQSGAEAMASATTMAAADSAEEASDATVVAGGATPTTAAATDGAADGAAAGGGTGAENPTTGALGAGGVTVTPSAADLGRKLIFTANLDVAVDDVAAASAAATEIVETQGGFLFGQNTAGGAEARSELTFKVLPADFNTVLDALGTVGELRNQTVTTDDVTERVVDLESRIRVAELGVERLRAALENTANLTDYAQVEQLLLARESDLEVMRGEIRTLQDRVDLATIVLVLTQDRLANNIEVVISTYEGRDEGQGCPGQDAIETPADEALTVCFEITNLGDQTLTGITLTDTVLEIDDDTDLIPVFGSLEALAPGQSALVGFETVPQRDLRLRTRVSATPTDGVSTEATGPAVSAQASYDIRTFEPDRAPGFGDGFSAARSVLRAILTAVTVTLGFILPLLVLVPFLWVGWLGLSWLRRRRPASPGQGPGRGDNPPPPPAPQPVPVGATAAPTTGPSPAAGDPPPPA